MRFQNGNTGQNQANLRLSCPKCKGRFYWTHPEKPKDRWGRTVDRVSARGIRQLYGRLHLQGANG